MRDYARQERRCPSTEFHRLLQGRDQTVQVAAGGRDSVELDMAVSI